MPSRNDSPEPQFPPTLAAQNAQDSAEREALRLLTQLFGRESAPTALGATRMLARRVLASARAMALREGCALKGHHISTAIKWSDHQTRGTDTFLLAIYLEVVAQGHANVACAVPDLAGPHAQNGF